MKHTQTHPETHDILTTPKNQKRPLITPLTLTPHNLPLVLQGLTIALVADLHIRQPRRRHDEILQTLDSLEIDILALTGDFMSEPGSETATHQFIIKLLKSANPNLGAFGVFGNHDSPNLRKRLNTLPITFLNNNAYNHHRLPLTLLGLNSGYLAPTAHGGDLLQALRSQPNPFDELQFRILLAHTPNWITPAADANIPLLLTSHTHGGQIRLPNRKPLYNATRGWPNHLSSGVVQHRQTLSVTTRGLGESHADGLRLFCPPHIPLITLKRPTTQQPTTDEPTALIKW